MSNALIGWPIYSDIGVRLTPTLSGGSWVAALPLTNLQLSELYKVARSTSLSSAATQFTINLGEPKQVRCIGVPKHSCTATAQFRFIGQSAALATVYDSGYFAPFPAGLTRDDVEGMNLGVWKFPSSTLGTIQYVQCLIDDAANAAGYIDINRFVVTGAVSPSSNLLDGSSKIGLETATVTTDSESSVTSTIRKPTRRNATIAFGEQTDAAAFGAQFPFQRIAGTDRQFVFSWDPADTTYLHHRTFLATLSKLSDFDAIIGMRWGIPYAIREVL